MGPKYGPKYGRGLWPPLLRVAACAGLLLCWYSGAWPESGVWTSGPAGQEACPRPLALALQQRERLRQLFNLSTPVLLWGGLLTLELWDGLSQLRGPYGWHGLPREAITSTLRV